MHISEDYETIKRAFLKWKIIKDPTTPHEVDHKQVHTSLLIHTFRKEPRAGQFIVGVLEEDRLLAVMRYRWSDDSYYISDLLSCPPSRGAGSLLLNWLLNKEERVELVTLESSYEFYLKKGFKHDMETGRLFAQKT